jgi:hypothetical protein
MKNPAFLTGFSISISLFYNWQKLLGIEKLLGFLQRVKSRPGVGAARVRQQA